MAYSLYQLLWFFLLYSFLGWCAGVAAAALRKHAFINTGFLNLPLCPIYGAAAVLFSIFLRSSQRICSFSSWGARCSPPSSPL